jgi:type III secretion protein SpaR/YscT/HrcT
MIGLDPLSRIVSEEMILGILLVLARSLPLLLLVPFLGGRWVPRSVKLGVALAFSVFLLPYLAPPQGSLGATEIFFLVMKEAAVGTTLGFVASMVFLGFSSAGRLVDVQRGVNVFEALDYHAELRGSAMGQLYGQAAVQVFLLAGGHLVFLRAYFQSFEAIPVWQFPQFAQGTTAILDALARVSADVLWIALQLSAPALIVIFLTDVAFGVFGRTAPQVNAFVASQPAKVAIGVGVTLLILRVLFDQFEAHGRAMLVHLFRLLEMLE